MRLLVLTKRSLALSLAVLIGASFAFYGAAKGASYAVSLSQKKVPIYKVETTEKKVAVTFDAAWSADDTAKIIEILNKYNAKATFFAVGSFVEKNPDEVRALFEAGNEIANHSDTHAAFSSLDRDGIKKEIENCNKKIEQITNQKCTLVRAPSGDYTNASIEVADEMNMKMIQWSLDSLDWKGLSSDDMAEKIITNAENGDIILFHNGIENTPAALEKVLSVLQEEGYSFVTVSDLIYPDNYEISFDGTQKKK